MKGESFGSEFWPKGIALLSFPSGFFLELARKKSDIPAIKKYSKEVVLLRFIEAEMPKIMSFIDHTLSFFTMRNFTM
ncbi:hypothetical protein [Sulfurimonas sp. HSL3-7]|uniref:hypothetical protein n=1 Tax=Sulfonitrofixus jiaomeiensis TaxID=3131938 RepID=UPI0031F81686